MGDRCYIEVEYRKKDEVQIRDIIGCDWEEVKNEDCGVVTGVYFEANCGMYDELQRMANDSIVFKGYHGSGGDYGAASFACFQGILAYQNTLDGTPVIAISENCVMNEVDLEAAKEYFSTRDKVVELFESWAKIIPSPAGVTVGRSLCS